MVFGTVLDGEPVLAFCVGDVVTAEGEVDLVLDAVFEGGPPAFGGGFARALTSFGTVLFGAAVFFGGGMVVPRSEKELL